MSPRSDGASHPIEMPERAPASTARKVVIAGVTLGALTALLIIGIVPRLARRADVQATTAEINGPRRVVVATVHPVAGPTTVTLPGSANAFRAAGVYAKASGFVRKVNVDLGDRVKAGQVLVELEIPENDEDVRRARAQLEAAEANVGLFEANASRNSRLAQQGIVAPALSEQVTEQANSARAAAKTSRAELQRLTAVQSYQRVVAPFAGVVSRRLVEPGQLVNVGTGSGPGALLVEISDTSRLRVFFDVPQNLAIDLKVGQKAKVFYPNAPDRQVDGEILRTAGALDPTLRTLKAEIDLDDKSGILAGSFVNVTVAIPRAAPVIVIPASALAVQKEGTLVAVVSDGKIAWRHIKTGRDLGKEIEVVVGLSDGDKVVLNPQDDLTDGMEVHVTERSKS